MNAQTQQLTQARKVPDNFPAMLERFKGEIARALPKHLDGDRMARIALTSFRSNPKLAKCEPRSVFAAIIIASQLGLEPGVMGQCYLIPYKEECQLQIGYQGLIELVRRSGKVSRIEAHVVHVNDEFDYSVGLTTSLVHKPVLDGDPGEPRLAYAVAEIDGGGFHVEVMTRRQIEAIRDRSQNVISAKKYGKKTPWDTDPEEMWRKTLIRRICKYLPKSAELATALALDNTADTGKQHVDIDDAIEGTWAPVQEEEAPATESSVVAMPQSKAAAEVHPAPANAEEKPEASPPQAKGKRADTKSGQPLSDSLEAILNEACRKAGVSRAQLAERYPVIDTSNYNAIREELLEMASAAEAASRES
jgi:recombination protein RecT